ncbi:DUF3822 family protein [Bacteroidota bacterium]
MDIVRCIDETFDLNATLSYQLYIQIGLDGLSFCVLNTVNNKFISLVHYPFDKGINPEVIFENYEEIISKDELLNKKFKSVYSIYNSNKYSIVPNELFEVKHSKLFFEYNHILSKLDELHYTKLKNIEATVVFSVPNQFTNPLLHKFNSCEIHSKATPFIEKGIELSNKNKAAKYYLLNFDNENINIIVLNKSKLLLYNSFHYYADADILYYLHNIAKQINWDVKNIEIICYGNISKTDSILKSLLPSFKSVKLQTFDKEVVYSYTFNKVNLLKFYNLLNLYRCV